MKIRKRFVTALLAMMICSFLTVFTANADDPPEEAPMFCANIEFSPQGYIVKGTFTEFPADISRAETLYSLDKETWQISGEEWNITNWSDGPWTAWDQTSLEKFQNQTCLHTNSEPLKSYLAGELNRFYVKLRLTRENGITYDTQAAVIDRGSPMPLPEEMTPSAVFPSSIRVRTFRPFSYYGRYQITVREDATPEEIAAYLPDTLPIEVNLRRGIDHVADGIVDCPVTWKSLEDLTLTAGESVTVPDAAEEIVIPGGTVLNTPLGIFELNDSLRIDQDGLTDEVRIVLNVIAKDSSPTGALSCDFNGLDIAFHQKPTGAAAIRAYVLSGGDTRWTELPDLPLLEAVNAQPSTPGSGYTYVLDHTHELYQSYTAAYTAGIEPSPFFIGIKIEGGVYDGKELILPWPDTYDIPLALPKLGGSGGNEDNAGADNKDDATSEGQRPNLPGSDDSGGNKDNDASEGQQPNLPDSGNKDDGSSQEQRPNLPNSGNSGGNKDDDSSQGQRPNLPNSGNSGGKNNAPSRGKSDRINHQNPKNPDTASISDTFTQAPMAAQAKADTAAEARYPSAASSVNAETGARTKSTVSTPPSAPEDESAASVLSDAKDDHITPTSRSAQNDKSGSLFPSGIEEKSRLYAENSDRTPLLLILTTILAVLCIIGYLYYRRYRQTKHRS